MLTTTVLVLMFYVALGDIELEYITGAIFSGIIWPVFVFLILGFAIAYIAVRLETSTKME